jgi:hypothetical protein
MKVLLNITKVAFITTVVMLGTIFAGEFNAVNAEAHFKQTTETISQADHELAERMCGVCQSKIEKYKAEMNAQPIANEMEIKTLETYKTRLTKFCAMKNQPVEN